MSKFDSQKIDAINARESVEELIIDGTPILTQYEEELQHTTYMGEFRSILKYIEYAANGGSLPNTKMRKYGAGNGITEYEFKSKHLRVWAIQLPSKKMLVFGGFKNTQSADEVAFRSIKNRYLEQVKNIDNGQKRIT